MLWLRIRMKFLRARWCVALLLQACASAYSPPGPVVPLLDERGDLSLGANVRPALPTRGATAYLAAAPSEKSRVYTAGSFLHYDSKTTDDDAKQRMHEKNHT